jgi:hypothetical protein
MTVIICVYFTSFSVMYSLTVKGAEEFFSRKSIAIGYHVALSIE